jgi:hypothetical protein
MANAPCATPGVYPYLIMLMDYALILVISS